MFSLADSIQPMPGKIAVLVDTKDQITPAGLLIPEGVARTIHESRPTQGEVVAIGTDGEDDLEDSPYTFTIGDRVLFGKYSGTELKFIPDKSKPAERIIILSVKDVLAKFLNPEAADKVTIKG